MKLYTRTGDDGTTALFGGGRVRKDHPRVAAYGDIDELNSAIGLASAALEPAKRAGDPSTGNFFTQAANILARLQSRLFDIGADLATPSDSKHESKIHRVDERDVAESENWIDQLEAGNEPQTHFVLPGGAELSARLHLARTICRRAERSMVTLAEKQPINPQTIIYMNRVSDLLFAMARRANKEGGVADVIWESKRQNVKTSKRQN